MSTNLVVTVPAKACANEVIEVVGYPSITIADFRAVQRLDGTVTNERAASALHTALLRVVEELVQWQLANATTSPTAPTAPTAPTESAIDPTFIGVLNRRQALRFTAAVTDTSHDEHHFRTAVYAYAAATLHEQMRGFDTTNDHRKTSDEAFVDYIAADLCACGFTALRALTGAPVSICELL